MIEIIYIFFFKSRQAQRPKKNSRAIQLRVALMMGMSLFTLEGMPLWSDHTRCLSLDAATSVGRTTSSLSAAQATGAQTAWVSGKHPSWIWILASRCPVRWKIEKKENKNVSKRRMSAPFSGKAHFCQDVENCSCPLSFSKEICFPPARDLSLREFLYNSAKRTGERLPVLTKKGHCT